MKRLSLIIILMQLIVSCTVRHQVSSLLIDVEQKNNQHCNNIYNITIEAIDNKGIETITFKIPEMKISETYKLVNKRKWVYEREVILSPDEFNGFIELHLVNQKGEEKIKKVNLIGSSKLSAL